jgi:hypothetical protein
MAKGGVLGRLRRSTNTAAARGVSRLLTADTDWTAAEMAGLDGGVMGATARVTEAVFSKSIMMVD